MVGCVDAIISFPEEETEALEIKQLAQGHPYLYQNMGEPVF